MSTDVMGELVAATSLSNWLAWRDTAEPAPDVTAEAEPLLPAPKVRSGRHRRQRQNGTHRKPTE